MLPQKPYALSCDRNSEPILEVFKDKLQGRQSLLEVGSGTGQHAIFMAPYLPELTWTLTDQMDRHEGISLWLNDFPRVNLRGPLHYEIGKTDFPEGSFDCVFTANVLHIVSWELCLKLFDDLAENLATGALFLVYGAFNYNGEFTSESNKKFQEWLKEKHPQGGLRNFEDVKEELSQRNFEFKEDIEMPANNRMLIFEKK